MAVIGRKILGQALCYGKGGSSLSSNACMSTSAPYVGAAWPLRSEPALEPQLRLVVQGKKTTCDYRILVLEGALGVDLFFYHGETEARTGRSSCACLE